jgi:hypothetical protein
MRRVLIMALICLLVPKLLAAEDLHILALYARVTPVRLPIPDATVESILRPVGFVTGTWLAFPRSTIPSQILRCVAWP